MEQSLVWFFVWNYCLVFCLTENVSMSSLTQPVSSKTSSAVPLPNSTPGTMVLKNEASNRTMNRKVLWNIPEKPTAVNNSLKLKKTVVKNRRSNISSITSLATIITTKRDQATMTIRRQRSVPANSYHNQSDPEVTSVRKTRLGLDDHLFMSINGSCERLDISPQITTDFATAFEQTLKGTLLKCLPMTNNSEPMTFECRTWEIRCGPSLVLNFSLTNFPLNMEAIKACLLDSQPFSFTWNDLIYAATGFSQIYMDVTPNSDHDLARLQVGPATGHFYQGFIYIIIGIIIAVVVLILATICLVRLHRRQRSHLSMTPSGECTPTRVFQDVSDYTLTRIPRTTKLYMDDMERARLGWGYTNPDYQPDGPPKGGSAGHLHFVNNGLLPRLEESTVDENSRRTVQRSSNSNSLHGSQQTDTTSSGNVQPKSFVSVTNSLNVNSKQQISVPFSIPGDLKMVNSAASWQDMPSRIKTETSTHI